MQNIKDLRTKLSENFEKVSNGEIGIKKANSIANAGDKVLKSILTEILYNSNIGKVKNIKFMEY